MSIDINLRLDREKFHLTINESLSNSGLTAIFGPSGCGKTTLLRCIAGLEKGNGSVLVNDIIWQDSKSNTFVPSHQRNLVYIFQDARLLPHLTVYENLVFNLKYQRVNINDETLSSVIEKCALFELNDKLPSQLSGGQKQRVNIARALLSQPSLILMDEPLSALDSSSRQEMLNFLKALKDDISAPILYVSHSIDEVAQLADDVIIMRNGKLLHKGPALAAFAEHTDVFSHDQLSSVFEGKVVDIDTKGGIAKVFLKNQSSAASTCVYLNDTTLEASQNIRLRVAAKDVSISLRHNKEQSIQNIIPATIRHIDTTIDSSSVLVTLDINDQTLHALITALSLKKLQLEKGQSVWAQVKALSVYD
ncbi:hypothetical protein A3762_15115 [Oleiphilus sp. HI0125]|uniref:molybdenum ABC transporter ATP-binding protein n=1 Tax=Oleiphilus sp. HI0125 TaxID=1822266 RepID=UPI0007C299D8|nr:molybdenum ABC transporter ATP-binding protein [Oleiphilus sp. HI0125]KZZ60858.1 hypothetical protein A3762_15115 [Oleiphilus sp. HI0125]